MSEVIMRMELRDNCLDCDLHQTMYGDAREDTEVFCVKERRYIGKRFGPTKDLARPDWCPIFAVLPEKHGRLVDADGLIEKINAARIRVMQNGGDTNPYWECSDLCLQTPAIVPATEGGNHEAD